MRKKCQSHDTIGDKQNKVVLVKRMREIGEIKSREKVLGSFHDIKGDTSSKNIPHEVSRKGGTRITAPLNFGRKEDGMGFTIEKRPTEESGYDSIHKI
jgi:hypothetical protein